MTIVTNSAHAYLKQLAHAHAVMAEFRAYAASIGCVLGEGANHDSIEATAEQAELLDAKWQEMSRG